MRNLQILLVAWLAQIATVSSQCVPFSSRHCPSFIGNATLSAQFTAARFGNDVSLFDAFLASSIYQIQEGLFSADGSLSCQRNITPLLRYSKTVVCELVLLSTEVSGQCNDGKLQRVCRDTCQKFTDILTTVLNNNDYYCAQNASAKPARDASINSMNERCRLAPTANCLLVQPNELSNCGFNSYSAAKQYCLSNQESCCSSLTPDPTATPPPPGCFQPLFSFLSCEYVYGVAVFILFAIISTILAVVLIQEQKKNRPFHLRYPTQQIEDKPPSVGFPPEQIIAANGSGSRVVSVIYQPSISIVPQPDIQQLFTVIQSFAPEQEGDVELIVGDKVTITQDLGGGWVSGVNLRSGMDGVFPKSHAVL